jgi:hypothetical protein
MNSARKAIPQISDVQLAQEFSRRVRKKLGADWAEVIRRNRCEPDASVCHSEDFCDARVLMLQAVMALIPEEYFKRVRSGETFNVEDFDDVSEAAWKLARAHHFTL